MQAGVIEIQMMADLARIKRDMDEARGIVGGAVDRMDSAVSMLKGAFASLSAVEVVRQFVQFADAATELRNKLNLSSQTAAESANAYSRLYGIAQQSRVSFVELGNTYASIARVGNEMGVSQDRLLRITEAIGNAMTISGGSAASMQAALVQLGQGLASGTLRGEELNSVFEQTPRLARAIADGLGVPIGQLRELGSQGQLTAEAVMAALERSAPQLAREVQGSIATVSQAFTQLGNTATRFADEVNQASGATGKLSQLIAGLRAPFDVAAEAMERSRRSGEGWFLQFNDGIGAFLGRSAQLQLISREFMTVEQAAADAAATIRRLDAQAPEAKTSIYWMDERARAARDLAAANAVLRAATGQVNDVQQAMIIQGKERERVEASLRAQAAELTAVRQKLAGVDKDYLPTLEKLQRWRDEGIVGEAEYVRLVSDLAAKNFKKADSTKAVEDAQKRSNEEARRANEEYQRLVSSITDKTGVMLLEQQQTGSLSEAQRIALRVMQDLQSGTLRLTDARKVEISALLEQMLRTEASTAATKAEAAAKAEAEKATAAAAKSAAQYLDSLQKQTAGLDAEIAKQLEQNETLRTGTRGIADSTAAKYEAAAAAAERAALVALERNEDLALYETLKLQAEKFRELGRLKGEGVHLTAAKEANDAWAATTKSIGDGITDSLFRAFESGKGFWSTLWDGVKNTVKTTVLKPIIEDTVRPFADIFRTTASNISATVLKPTFGTDGLQSFLSAITGGFRSVLSWIGSSFSSVFSSISSGLSSVVSGLGGMFGSSGAAAGGLGGGGGLGGLGNLGNLGSIAGAAGSFGTGISAGLAALVGEAGLAGGLSAGVTAIGAGNVAAGLGTLVGAAGPYALAAIAAYYIGKKLFGGGGGPKTESGFDTTGNGQVIALENPDQARSIFEGVQSLYANYAKALGGTPEALTGTAFVSVDTKGKANTQFVLDAMINGTNVFSRNNRLTGGNVEDVGRSSEALAAAVAEAQTRATLAALQATTFSDPAIANMISQIDKTGSAAAISQQIQAALTYKAQQDLKAQADAAAAAASAATSAAAGSAVSGGAMDAASVAQLYQAPVINIDGMVSEIKGLREDLRALGTDLRTDGAAGRTVVDRAAVAAERIEEFLRAVSPDGRSISTRAAS